MLKEITDILQTVIDSYDDILYSTVKDNEKQAVLLNQDQLLKGRKPNGDITPPYSAKWLKIKQKRGTLFGNKVNWSLKDSGDWYANMKIDRTLFGFEIDTTSRNKTYIAEPQTYMGLSKENEEIFAESISEDFSNEIISIINANL